SSAPGSGHEDMSPDPRMFHVGGSCRPPSLPSRLCRLVPTIRDDLPGPASARDVPSTGLVKLEDHAERGMGGAVLTALLRSGEPTHKGICPRAQIEYPFLSDAGVDVANRTHVLSSSHGAPSWQPEAFADSATSRTV